MDQTQKGLGLEESIRQVMQTLPPLIRDYLTQGKYMLVAKDLMAKYNLRIDQGGVLERELMLLLMGIENPDEFVDALTDEARLDRRTVDAITQDVNDRIFIPLRREERAKEGTPAAAPQPVAPAPAAGAAQPQRFFHLDNRLPPPKVAMPQAVRNTGTLGDAMRMALSPSMPPKANTLLEDHEEKHIEFNKAAVPASLPGVIPEVRPSPTIPKVEPQIQKAQSKPVPPFIPASSIKEYSTDPYREPIDEK